MDSTQDQVQAFNQGLNQVPNAGPGWSVDLIRWIEIVVLILVLIKVIRVIRYYAGSNLKDSIELGIKLLSPLDSSYVSGNKVKMMANAAVIRSRVSYEGNKVTLIVPYKPRWAFISSVDVYEVILEKLKSEGFASYREIKFEKYTFSAISKNSKEFKIIGEY